MEAGDTEHDTHLAMDWARGIQRDKTKYYPQKGPHARKRVDLSTIERENQPSVAEETKVKDPYRSPVGATSPNDTPFVSKGSEEFPTSDEDCYAI